MTIDEKIKQAAEKQSQMAVGEFCKRSETQVVIRVYFVRGANFVKSEMLADMQKLVEALEFYASDVNWNSQGHFHNSRIDSTDMDKINNFSDDYYFGGKRARQALAAFNAKYNKGEK